MSAMAPPPAPSWWLRALGNFAVQRPFYILGAVIAFLPMTAFEWCPLHAMLGNLFVEYGFGWAFWFGFALFGAVWAVMLTACLNLDGERDLPDRWSHNLPRPQRRVTIPMNHVSTFIWFSLLGLPGFVVPTLQSETWARVIAGLILGGVLAYLLMDVVAYLIRCGSPHFRVLPWAPLPLWGWMRLDKLVWITRLVSRLSASAARAISLRDYFFRDAHKNALRDDYFFAVFSLLGVSVIYWVIYRILRPGSWTQLVDIRSLPPAGFLYALLLPLIWLTAALWFHLRRYRITLMVAVLVGALLYGVGSTRFVESKLGGPAHTYAVFESGDGTPLPAADVVSPLGNRIGPDQKKPTLIVVAASGGGILAAGWTSKVLSELHSAYGDFWRDLRLISGVSGGAVGTAHYVGAQEAKGGLLPCDGLDRVVENSMRTSLAVTAYGFAFPDFRRALFPIWTDEEFDRGRLAEADWRKRSNDLRDDLRDKLKGTPRDARVLLSDWKRAIGEGRIPAVIFNTTVMETGERIALTPLKSLASHWAGWSPDGTRPYPDRYTHARTLFEFLGKKPQSSLDVWTAARLSATFSYVTPAARASFVERQERIPKDNEEERNGLLHLIDGGYNDNSGVASALDWLGAALADRSAQDLPFSRVALIEIRAKPFSLGTKPSSQWEAAWLGPVYGLMSSWDYAQTASDDTAVNRMIGRFKDFLASSGNAVPLEAFVFVPRGVGPLSWHLSTNDKKRYVHDPWGEPENKKVLQSFLRFVNGVAPGDASKPPPEPFRTCLEKKDRPR